MLAQKKLDTGMAPLFDIVSNIFLCSPAPKQLET